MPFDAGVPEMTVKELQESLEKGERPFLLDVREEEEYEICHLPGATLVPMMSLFERKEQIPRDRAIVVYCHTGSRSAKAADYLLEQGFSEVKNLRGGIDAWAQEVDPRMKRY